MASLHPTTPVVGVRTWPARRPAEDVLQWPDLPCAPCDDPYEQAAGPEPTPAATVAHGGIPRALPEPEPEPELAGVARD